MRLVLIESLHPLRSQIERDAEILRLQTLNYPDRMREKQEVHTL